MLSLSGESNVSGKRHRISIRMEFVNKNLQNPYLTMRAAVKESLVLPGNLGSQGAVYHLDYI
jgi:hypothetical protein